MLNVGMSEILVFAIIALIILGPDKLPTAVRAVLKWYRHIKLMISNVQRDIERELEITEIREKMTQELERIKAIEDQMQSQLNQIKKEVELIEKNPKNASEIETQEVDPLESKVNPKQTNKIDETTTKNLNDQRTSA